MVGGGAATAGAAGGMAVVGGVAGVVGGVAAVGGTTGVAGGVATAATENPSCLGRENGFYGLSCVTVKQVPRHNRAYTLRFYNHAPQRRSASRSLSRRSQLLLRWERS